MEADFQLSLNPQVNCPSVSEEILETDYYQRTSPAKTEEVTDTQVQNVCWGEAQLDLETCKNGDLFTDESSFTSSTHQTD